MKIKAIGALLLSAWLVSGTVFSATKVDNNDASAYIRATLNNSPALATVNLEILRLDNHSIIEARKAHSLVLTLKPGNYKATARMDNIIRDRTFSVLAGDKVDVVIAMDK